MICKNCGREFFESDGKCPFCGIEISVAEFKNSTNLEDGVVVKKKSPKKAIIAVIAAILTLAIACGVFYIFKYQKNPEVQKEKLTELLNEATEKNIVEFIFEDFDSDGTYEAFAITSLLNEKADGFYTDADLLFVNKKSVQKIKENIVCKNNGLLEIKGKHFVSIEIKTGDKSRSYIYSADGEKLVESDISGEHSGVIQKNGKIVVNGDKAGEKGAEPLVIDEEDVIKTEEVTTVPAEETKAEKVTANGGEDVTEKPTTTQKATTTKKTETTTKKAETTTKKAETTTKKPESNSTSSAFSNAKVGDYIKFGSYEQDNNTSNGKEAIEWLVLDKKDGKILVISKYGLDCQPYNEELVDITWENCTLRKWLNNEFINTAFSSTQRSMIPTVTVKAEDNPVHGTDAGNNTQDKVFLLSMSEAEKYFSSDYSLGECKPTAYAKSQGVQTAFGICWWWLRSPGIDQKYAAYVWDYAMVYDHGSDVNFYGDLNEEPYGIYNIIGAVRPALWITL